MRTINCSTSRLILGRPGFRRAFEPSNLRATSLRYQARIVSGRATVTTSARTLRPNRWPISASVARSASDSFNRPLQLGLQNPIFGGQIFDSRQQFLVHRPRDVGQNARPIHSSPTPAFANRFPKNPSPRDSPRPRQEWKTHYLFYGSYFLT